MNKYIDHTLLKQNATKSMIENLCMEAKKYNFKTVCVNPTWISYCKELLKGSDVGVCTVIGFPLGAMSIKSKVFEAKDAVEMGADEVDMVLNIGKLKDNDIDYIVDEISQIKEAVKDKVLKVIIETCLLTDEEKIKACEAIIKAKADFVKTSTGFSLHGATIDDVKLLKKHSKGIIKVKAAGGVKTYQDMLDMIKEGADRIGTSSGVKLINNDSVSSDY